VFVGKVSWLKLKRKKIKIVACLHLDIVSTSNRAEVSSARGFWFSGLGSDLCDDGFNQVVRFFGATCTY